MFVLQGDWYFSWISNWFVEYHKEFGVYIMINPELCDKSCFGEDVKVRVASGIYKVKKETTLDGFSLFLAREGERGACIVGFDLIDEKNKIYTPRYKKPEYRL